MYKINENFPTREELSELGPLATSRIKGELMIDEQPVCIKDVGSIK